MTRRSPDPKVEAPTLCRFLSRFVPKRYGCWIWISERDECGYGRIWVRDRRWSAHRLSWHVFRGNIPIGMHVTHDCDTPGCVNPDHLSLGTHQTNMHEMAVRGRAAGKLSAEKAERIRRLYSTGKYIQRELGEMFGVHRVTISDIVRGKKFKHASGPRITLPVGHTMRQASRKGLVKEARP